MAKAARGISKKEVQDVEERASPRVPVIYEVVRRQGNEELARPVWSLWWSGVAAGLSISFSLLAQAIILTALPADAAWAPLVSSFGYCIGFLMVILGRQQLFTESTITAVLPVINKPTLNNIQRMLRLWSVVLIANLAGTLFAALLCTFTPVLKPEWLAGMLKLSEHLVGLSVYQTVLYGIASGFLMAALVWMIPSSEGNQFFVITAMTYLIAIGGFTHVVAGSMEAFLLLVNGKFGFLDMLGTFLLPVLAGNIIGGTVLFAMLSYAQVMKEI